MRNATAILIAASLAAGAPHAVAFQEPAPPPAGAPSPATAAPPAAAPSDVKVAGRDVPAPKRTRFVTPVFPLEAQAAGQRGIVILELVIDAAGKVSTADVLRSVPPFDEAALTAVRQWEYEVTKVDGKAVPVRLTVPITFALKLPEMTREAGIPELRQGASPFFPPEGVCVVLPVLFRRAAPFCRGRSCSAAASSRASRTSLSMRIPAASW